MLDISEDPDVGEGGFNLCLVRPETTTTTTTTTIGHELYHILPAGLDTCADDPLYPCVSHTWLLVACLLAVV